MSLLKKCFLTAVLAPGLSAFGSMEKPQPGAPHLEKATFAAGCFWCTQPPFDKVPGVVRTTVGYTGGHVPHPTYEQVCSGTTGHAESIEIVFDPSKVSYEKLLDVFWHNINPTQKDAQFPDAGRQYRTAIFYHTEDQKRAALASKAHWEKDGRFGGPVMTEIAAASEFWPAEGYHQQCYLKNPGKYRSYHDHSGRDEYFHKIWGK